MVVVSLNKTATKEFYELKRRIAKQLGLNEKDLSASMVIHELYKLYMSQRRDNGS